MSSLSSEWPEKRNSPYINRFLQPDTIIPGMMNPQNWNRFSYVRNNPIRYTDPTGHSMDDGDLGSSGLQPCNIFASNCPGNLGGAGNGGNGGISLNNLGGGEYNGGVSLNSLGLSLSGSITANLNSHGGVCTSCHTLTQTSISHGQPTVSVPITLALTLNGIQSTFDYYGDYGEDTNVPYFPGGETQPNPCPPGFGSGLCLVSLFTSLIPPQYQPNTTSNFFLNFNVYFTAQGPTTVSGVNWPNQYTGKAVFDYLYINNVKAYHGYDSYMPMGNQSVFGTFPTNNNGLQINALIETMINTPNGPDSWLYRINITIPPLQ